MSRMQAAMLPDGRRLHLNDGPIDLVIAAEGESALVARAYAAATARFETVLDELCAELPLLRRPVGEAPRGRVARRMWQATLPLASHGFITPMAAVAGSVAEEILAAMLEHPVLVNRPIVCTPRGVRLCRPSETVLDLLERWPAGPFHKEDGGLLIDAAGRRVG